MEPTFKQWKLLVDDSLESLCRMSSDDLPDWHYYTDYDNGLSPHESAKAALTNAMNY